MATSSIIKDLVKRLSQKTKKSTSVSYETWYHIHSGGFDTKWFLWDGEESVKFPDLAALIIYVEGRLHENSESVDLE
jgi:hypothetical protein